MNEHKKHGSSFSSKMGFILAAAGSAVGLGNLWRFPYLAAKYGGGSFLLIYVILAVTFGFALMITEIALGRKTGKSALYAFSTLHEKCGFIGILASIVPIIILPYYCVIGGWVIKFAWAFLTGSGNAAAADDYFSNFIARTGEPVMWLVFFILATSVVILLGVNKGIENISKVLMPLLVVLSVIIAVFVVTRPGAGAGIVYYLKPDLSKISANAFLAALGQLFYSMSLAMGIMITYGSYMKKNEDIESSVRNIEIFDTGIAFLAGLMIVPAVFVFSGGDQASLKAGPTLMFITLPKVFASMGFGTATGIVFFILVLLAALTSAVSLMETSVSTFMDELHWSRKKCCGLMVVIMIVLGTASSMGYGLLDFIRIFGMNFLDFFDFMTNSVMMPLAALATCILILRVVGIDGMVKEIEQSSPFRRKKLYRVFIKYFAPICLIIILLSSIANVLGIISM